MTSSRPIPLNEEAAAAMSVAATARLNVHQMIGKLAAFRYVFNSAAAVITRKIDAGNAPNRTIHCAGR